jgi:hypothetical protein
MLVIGLRSSVRTEPQRHGLREAVVGLVQLSLRGNVE